MDNSVLFEYHTPEIGVIVFNRPNVRNAMNLIAMETFSEIVDKIAQDENLRVILLTGNGKAFASGADIKEWDAFPDREGGRKVSSIMGDALQKFRSLPTINIGLINGAARGGGAEIAIMCDFRIMSEDASISFVHGKLGITPGWGGGERLFNMVGYSKALELFTTTKILSASEANEIGISSQIVKESRLFGAGLEMAADVCLSEPHAVHAIKKHFLQITGETTHQTLKREREIFIDLWATETRQQLFSKALNKSN